MGKNTVLGARFAAWSGLLLYFVVLSVSFSWNGFQVATSEFYSNWQQDSQSLVVNSLDSGSLPSSPWGLLGRSQQLGYQGHLLYSLEQALNLDLSGLMLLTAVLTAFVMAVIVGVLWFRGNPLLSLIFGYVVLTSPWLTASARNLYWVPWTWFLPMLLALLLASARSVKARALFHAALLIAFMFQFSTGYEFLTSVVIAAAAMPLIQPPGPVKGADANNFRGMLLSATILANGALAFAATLLWHGFQRGSGSIPNGISEIWTEDVLRRTYGDPDSFDSAYGPSLEAGPLDVLGTYVSTWTTPVTNFPLGPTMNLGLPAGSLVWLLAVLVLVVTLVYFRKYRFRTTDLTLLAMAFAVPVSWFVLAKSHSFIHTHINFVLWYPLPLTLVLYFVVIGTWGLMKKTSPAELSLLTGASSNRSAISGNRKRK